MEITKEIKDDVFILNISGEMVSDTIKPLKTVFNQCVNTGTPLIILNLEQVRMIDSSGIGAIVFMLKRLRPKRDMKIVNARYVITTFHRVGLDKVIDISPSANNDVINSEIPGCRQFVRQIISFLRFARALLRPVSLNAGQIR